MNLEKRVNIKSPTRVDLAGGTLDMWPLYNFVGGAKTINLAIDVYTEVDLKERADKEIHLTSPDLNLSQKFSNRYDLLNCKDRSLDLLKAQVRFWMPDRGFEMKTSSQSPVGGGLGGSSSLTISMMKAFESWLGQKPREAQQMVHEAHNIEAWVLNTPTGTQDYYPAFSGGLNILTYSESGIQQEVLPVDSELIEERFLLVNTGKSHHSGLNNFEVLKSAVQKEAKTLKALMDLKEIADEVALGVRDRRWSQMGPLFHREFEARVALAPGFSSPEIQKISDLVLKKGAEAVKICGAGGGGCVMIWCGLGQKNEVQSKCQKAGFQVLNAKPVAPL